jgi:hypothetical protein
MRFWGIFHNTKWKLQQSNTKPERMDSKAKLIANISKAVLKMPPDEYDQQLDFFNEARSIRKQGYLTAKQFLFIAKWKSPRPLRFYQQNSPAFIKEVSRLSFQVKDEKLRIHLLCALSGVNIPCASAILMFWSPRQYGVIDIRVWQQLFKLKIVQTNPEGKNFSLEEWVEFLDVMRAVSKETGLTAREVEKRIFNLDKNTRKGKLYAK